LVPTSPSSSGASDPPLDFITGGGGIEKLINDFQFRYDREINLSQKNGIKGGFRFAIVSGMPDTVACVLLITPK
jgi:hypothetical protein